MEDKQTPAMAAKARQPVTSQVAIDRAVSGIENPEALPNKSVPSVPQDQEHEAFDIMDKNIERQQTWDSLPGSLGRTSTGFSHVSTGTELTEPDHATWHDEAEEMNASHSRRFTLPCRSRTSTFQSSPPSRAPSFMVDRNTGHLGRRPENMPGRPHPLSHSIPEQEDDEMNFQPSSPHTPAPTDDDAAELAEDKAADKSLPDETQMTTDEDEDWTPAELSSSQLSDDASDHPFDMDAAPQKPDEKLVQDVSDKLLKHLFGVDLQDLAAVDAAKAAHESISNCLNELFRIVPTSLAPLGSVSELTRGGGESSQGTGTGGGSGTGNGSSTGGNNVTGSGGGSGNGGGSKRRQNGAGNGSGHPGGDDFHGGDGPNENGKRPRLEHPADDKNFSCPFRKRNPVRFNVRHHQNCAVQSFPDISQLKRHVKIFHGRKVVPGFPCPRCRQPMHSQQALQLHLSAPKEEICAFKELPPSGDPEDGIDARVEDLLNGRRANTKVDSWEILWKTLFPDDDASIIPDPVFVPPIEFDEVLADFHMANSREALKQRLYERNLTSKSGRDVDAGIAALAEICERHIESVFEHCRNIKLDNHPYRERRRRVQRPRSRQESVSRGNLALVPPLQHEANYTAGESNGGSPASLNTAHSGGSWYNVAQTAMSTGGPVMAATTLITIPQAGFPGMPDASASGSMVLSSPASPDEARTPILQTTGGFPGHAAQLHHNRGPSADSAVGLHVSRTQDFPGGNMYQQQRGPVFSQPSQPPQPSQPSFADLNFTDETMAVFPVTTMAGPSLFPYDMSHEYEYQGLGGDMDGRN